jgi:hypothetical protein
MEWLRIPNKPKRKKLEVTIVVKTLLSFDKILKYFLAFILVDDIQILLVTTIQRTSKE